MSRLQRAWHSPVISAGIIPGLIAWAVTIASIAGYYA